MATDTSTQQPDTSSNPNTPSVPPMSMEAFAAGVKTRIPQLSAVPDDMVVKRVLELHPELSQHVVIGEPRRAVKRDRNPTLEQSMFKFFENHPTMRENLPYLTESLLGAGKGSQIPEAKNPVPRMLRGIPAMLNPIPQEEEEEHVMEVGIPPQAYRLAKSMVQQLGQIREDAWNSFDWKAIIKNAIEGPGKHKAVIQFKEGSGGGPQFAHAVAELATLMYMTLHGSGKTEEAAASAGQTSRNLRSGVQLRAQESVGTGASLAEETANKAVEGTEKYNADELARYEAEKGKHEAATSAAQQHNADIDEKFKTKVERLNQDYDQKIADVRKTHADNVKVRDQKVADLQAQHKAAVEYARKDWVQDAKELRGKEREQAKIEGKRTAIEAGKKKLTERLMDNVRETHAKVRKSLDNRWGQLKEDIGKDATVKVVDDTPEIPDEGAEEVTPRAPSIIKSIESGRAMLAGVPADLKIFNDIIKEITEKDVAEGEGGKAERVPKSTIPFDDARTQFSALGEKAYSASGIQRKALFEVYNAYDRALNETANAAGQGAAYKALKRDWSNYMHDWHDMSQMKYGRVVGEKGGGAAKVVPGSPLARAMRATLPQDLQDLALGRYSDPLLAVMARYRAYGASPELMGMMRKLERDEAALPKTKPVSGLETRTYPGAGPTAGIRVPARPDLPAPKAEPAAVPPPTEEVGALEADRAKKLERATQDKPEHVPLPDEPRLPDIHERPSMDQIVDNLRKAKAERLKKHTREESTITRHDLTMLGVAAAAAKYFTGHLSYAATYLGIRFGWNWILNTAEGKQFLLKVTPKDMEVMNDIYKRLPAEKVEAQNGIMAGIIDSMNKGQPVPPPQTFEKFLTKEQTQQLMKILADRKAKGVQTPIVKPEPNTPPSGSTGATPPSPKAAEIGVDAMQQASVSALQDYFNDKISIGDYKERLRKSFMNASEEKLDELARKAEQFKADRERIRKSAQR